MAAKQLRKKAARYTEQQVHACVCVIPTPPSASWQEDTLMSATAPSTIDQRITSPLNIILH